MSNHYAINRLKGLNIISEALKNLNIKFSIFDGALLGFIRDKKLIEWDWDAEIALFYDEYKDNLIDIIEKLRFRIRSVLKAKKSRYILLNAPNNRIKSISNILPVLKSPTVLPLEKDGWSSLHSVINEDKFWEVIDKLKEEGAEDILVCPIEKMVL